MKHHGKRQSKRDDKQAEYDIELPEPLDGFHHQGDIEAWTRVVKHGIDPCGKQTGSAQLVLPELNITSQSCMR